MKMPFMSTRGGGWVRSPTAWRRPVKSRCQLAVTWFAPNPQSLSGFSISGRVDPVTGMSVACTLSAIEKANNRIAASRGR